MKNGTEQYATAGKIYTGSGFISKPHEILFLDFEVNKKYKKVLIFTNVSYTFNSFKLLNIHDDFIDFFTVTYEKLGRMSAGVGVNIEIIFNPKINEDIHTGLYLYAYIDIFLNICHICLLFY
jgi:hypothetical protein